MNKRHVHIDLSSAGWLGWLAFALLAIPLLILSFFFFAAMIMLIALMVFVAVARLYWLRHNARPYEGEDAAPTDRLPPPPP